jgi:hypothetical protein
MAPRLTVALAVGAVACAAIAGCGEGEPAEAPSTPSQYVAAVQALLDPPARLAATLEQRARGEGSPPERRRLERLVAAARDRLEALRGLRLEDGLLRRQRDLLAGAYARLVPRMQTAVDALVSGNRETIREAADPFLDSLRTLPSAVPASPSR